VKSKSQNALWSDMDATDARDGLLRGGSRLSILTSPRADVGHAGKLIFSADFGRARCSQSGAEEVA
jgi:photosystem II stability/assembly factor-like uncharacterized protein